MEQLRVTEAAVRLGISEQAVRKRVQRGTLPHAKKSDGNLYVYLDSEVDDIAQVGQESSTRTEDPLTMNYIDKMYAAWTRVSTAQKRFAFLALVLPIVLLAFSGGAVSPEESLRISGVGFKVPLVVFMSTGAILIPLLLIAVLNLETLNDLYLDRISTLYKELGLPDSLITSSPIDPFVDTTIVNLLGLGYKMPTEPPESEDNTKSTSFPELVPRGSTLIIMGLYFLLPAAAQVGAGYKISELLAKVELNWFGETLAFVGALLGVVFAVLPVPQQGADWIVNLFILLTFATAFVYLPSVVDQQETVKSKVMAASFAIAFLGFFAIAGAWLGYLVAAP